MGIIEYIVFYRNSKNTLLFFLFFSKIKNERSDKMKPVNKYNYARTNAIKLNKKKVAIVVAIFLLIIVLIVKVCTKPDNETIAQEPETLPTTSTPVEKEPIEITDWNLRLANYENVLPEDFTVEVANIDETRQFDARAIGYLKQMINDMRKDGIKDIWVQSAYRSVERQKELYEQSIQKYIKQGKTQEEAVKLTDEYINKPGTSEHNIGLAVDFNFVNNEFEETKSFTWLKQHAEDYGFILRYPKEKEDITKISYESWHWRYVGKEHAKKINELNMCLEEYIDYLKNEG